MTIDTTEAAHGGSGLREGDAGIISCWRGKSDRLLVANPFADMALTQQGQRPVRWPVDAPALMIACGLAMRSFD
ncbi:hypothetical protein AWJ19_11930 [Paenibacillus sp. DMB5]|nr:hypothetical protein AWJ19_11930 [Paenibacillus sp. DMB5]